jgi:hypothetical protein
MAGATLASVPFSTVDWIEAIQSFSTGHPATGLISVAKGVFDYTFMRAYQQSYIEAFRANRGFDQTVRHNRFRRLSWLNAPLKGAEVNPQDFTKRRLVTNGFLRTFAPAVVLAVGMSGRVLLGLVFSWHGKPLRGGSLGASPSVPAGSLRVTRPRSLTTAVFELKDETLKLKKIVRINIVAL